MMKRARTALFLALIGFCASGAAASMSCAATEYIGGSCGDDGAGCERIGGTTCINNRCECPVGEQKCCGGGFDTDGNPLGCLREGDYRCRAISLCDVVVPVPTTTTMDAGPPPDAEPPPPEPECHEDTVVADCPPVLEPRCSAPICNAGECGVALQTSQSPIAWQYPGDCKSAFCAGGAVLFQQNPSDAPIFADPCVKDFCDVNGFPQREALPIGSPCIQLPGFCLQVQTSSGPVVKCVDCDQFDPKYAGVCPAGLACNQHRCVPPVCADLIQDNFESDVDCGGPNQCARCPIGAACTVDSDCAENKCEGPDGAKLCTGPTHDDGRKNDSETGVDCGCVQCAKLCDTGEGCASAAHCASGVCYGGKCLAPSCFDYVKNGDEVDVDCGGSCALACPPPGK
jgi:hypothetical protein